MNTIVKIPQGDQKVTVELTVKEMMALSGVRFHGNHAVEVAARKKLNDALEGTYEIEARKDTIDYQLLS
ncbi:hypothetical protein EBB07_03340 [Paenibacillaceae bacterium]|nr:hypothetical protein EBB07_03340 [Paenibacillaceae bacterium]